MSKTDPKGVSISTVERFWDRRPCNIKHSDSKIGTKEYFDEAEARRYFVEPHIPKFAEFQKWKNKKVLEIGCGMGTDAVNFARAGANYVGLELSGKSLDLTRKRFEIFGLEGFFYKGNAEEFDKIVPLQTFDLIYSFGVIHHTPHPEKVVKAIPKFMTHESEFRLMLYATNSWKNIMIKAGFDQPEAQSGCPIAYTYTKEEALELLSHFEVLEIQQDHIFPYIIEKYVRYEYEIQPWFRAMPEGLFQALKENLGWHLLIKCRLKS